MFGDSRGWGELNFSVKQHAQQVSESALLEKLDAPVPAIEVLGALIG